MERATGRNDPELRYGDFPELFWDAQPNAAIDVRNPVALARLLTRGRAEVIGRLVPLEVLRQQLEALTIPDHVRLFWRAVLRSKARETARADLLRPGP